jgi:mono/diheme cytochrome c family protein
MNPDAIKWDAEVKEYSPKSGEASAPFTFWLTNVSSSEVLVNSVRTSCGCTVAKLPAQPWRIAPGSNGPIEVTLSLAGKSGLIAKGVTVDTSVGVKQLTVRANIPSTSGSPTQLGVAGAMGDTERLKNMQLALADRQVVFKNQDCAKCHAEPAKGKTDGRLLYAAVCSTCHDSLHRAAMVPDLRRLPHPTDMEHWRKWIAYGRAGSMMPAFAESEGGPLNDQQINALAEFMLRAFPSRPQPAAVVPSSSAKVSPASSAPLIPRAN